MDNQPMLLHAVRHIPERSIHADFIDGWNQGSMPSNHYHGYYEIYFWFGDEMTYVLQDRLCRLRRGDILIVRPYVFHRTRYLPQTQTVRLVLYLGEDFLDIYRGTAVRRQVRQFLREAMHLSPEPDAAEGIRKAVMEELLPDLLRGKDGDEFAQQRAELRVAELLMELSALDRAATVTEPLKERLSPRERHVSDAVAYIHDHYSEPLTLDSLAGALYLSPTYLCQLFRRLIGLSVVEYLRARRLLEAQRLLTTTDMPIGDIGEAVGFGSGDYFIKTFRKVYGVTPKAWRAALPR